MPAQVILGELDQLLRRWREVVSKDLRVDVTAELLNSYLVESRLWVSYGL